MRWTHPDAGSGPSGAVHSRRGRLRPHSADRRMGPSGGVPASPSLGGCGPARVTMAVNVSAMEFRDENFLEGVFAVLDETGLDPRSLELELTESVLMKRAESTASILQTLRERGVQVAIDDFGTGYSSLSYLRKFPVDALKIDQSFVRQISTAGDDTTIVTAVIGMAPQPQAAGRCGGRGNAGGTGISSGASLRRGARILFQSAGACAAVRQVAGDRHTRAFRRRSPVASVVVAAALSGPSSAKCGNLTSLRGRVPLHQ